MTTPEGNLTPFVAVKTITQVKAVCPCCSNHHFTVSHLFDDIKHMSKGYYEVRWNCAQCLTEFDIRIYGPERVEFSQRPPMENPFVESLVLLKSNHPTNPIYAFVETREHLKSVKDSQLPDGAPDKEGQLAYYFDEHTCPTNWFRDTTRLIQDGDDDYHGIFTFEAALTKAEALKFLEKNPQTQWDNECVDGKLVPVIGLDNNVRLLFPQAYETGDTFEGERPNYARALPTAEGGEEPTEGLKRVFVQLPPPDSATKA